MFIKLLDVALASLARLADIAPSGVQALSEDTDWDHVPVGVPGARCTYDRTADVLYIAWGDEPTTHGFEVEPGVLVRLTDAEAVRGVTLYDVAALLAQHAVSP